MLQEILKGSGVLFSHELQGSAEVVLEAIRAHGLEGVVAKRRTSPYEPGKRTGAWLKVRANLEQELVIGGFVPGFGSFESLIVGYFEAKQLMFAGKVRAGYTPLVRREIFAKLRPLVVDRCPFANLPETRRSRWGEGLNAEDMEQCVWVKPVLVAQIAFLEWTRTHHLRHSKFIALRDDKPASEVARESTS
jgi:bifunctional non-homologous end joining protein LigD